MPIADPIRKNTDASRASARRERAAAARRLRDEAQRAAEERRHMFTSYSSEGSGSGALRVDMLERRKSSRRRLKAFKDFYGSPPQGYKYVVTPPTGTNWKGNVGMVPVRPGLPLFQMDEWPGGPLSSDPWSGGARPGYSPRLTPRSLSMDDYLRMLEEMIFKMRGEKVAV